jgi:hypothetical protein
MKYALGDTQLNARWGWQTFKNYGVISSSTRLSPTTYSGISGGAVYGDVALHIENAMERARKGTFQTNTGRILIIWLEGM